MREVAGVLTLLTEILVGAIGRRAVTEAHSYRAASTVAFDVNRDRLVDLDAANLVAWDANGGCRRVELHAVDGPRAAGKHAANPEREDARRWRRRR